MLRHTVVVDSSTRSLHFHHDDKNVGPFSSESFRLSCLVRCQHHPRECSLVRFSSESLREGQEGQTRCLNGY